MKVCGKPGCGELTKTPFCVHHSIARSHGWASSTRVKPKGWDVIRKRTLRKAGYKCVMCGNPADIADHLLPMAWGGHPTDEKNLRAMCRDCHDTKTNEEKRLGKVLAGMPPGKQEKAIGEFMARWKR